MTRERAFAHEAEMIVVEDMHERKRLMFERADAFVALPGGVGTLEELVEQLTWAQLGRHKKPILILNTAGFWDPFVTLVDHMRAAPASSARTRRWRCSPPTAPRTSSPACAPPPRRCPSARFTRQTAPSPAACKLQSVSAARSAVGLIQRGDGDHDHGADQHDCDDGLHLLSPCCTAAERA